MTFASRISNVSWEAAEAPSVLPPRRGAQAAADTATSNIEASDLTRCLWPLLEALGWTGDARHVAEALPHFADGIDLPQLRDVMTLLGYASIVMPAQRCDRIDPRLLPALVITEDGRALVIGAPDAEGRTLIRNPARDSEGSDDLRRLRGSVCLFRRADGPGTERLAAQNGRWLGHLLDSFRGPLLLAAALTVGACLLALAPALAMIVFQGHAMQSEAQTHARPILLALFITVAGVFVAEGFLRYWRGLVLADVGSRLGQLVAVGSFRHLLHLPLPITEGMRLGEKAQRLRATDAIRDTSTTSAAIVAAELPFAALFVVAIAIVAAELALVPLAVAAILALVARLGLPTLQHAVSQANQSARRKQDFLHEAILHSDHVRLSGAIPNWLERFRELSACAAQANFRVASLSALASLVGQIATLLGLAATIAVGALQVIDGTMSHGALLAVVALTWLALRPVRAGFSVLTGMEHLRAVVVGTNESVRGPQEETALARHKDVPPVRAGKISVSEVTLRFAPDLEPAILKLSAEFAPGEIVAITGPNGAGKSTLLKLILGLCQPQAGAVLIDGIDIGQHAPIALRQAIGYVPQDFELYHGTIRQNLLLSMPTATQSDIEEAARRAGVHDAILSWPDGYDHRLGDARNALVPANIRNGLALASAYLRDPSVLLLDEAIDNMDDRMTEGFHAELDRLRGRTTTIMITHRPSTMRRADRLLVIDEGLLVKRGKPAELLQ